MEDVHDADKEYVGTFELGKTSPSADNQTAVENVSIPLGIDRWQFEAVTRGFLGEIEQTPPTYSAVRIDGRRAHAMARAGHSIEMPSRRVLIHELRLEELQPTFFRLRVRCGTGTYLRSLGRDIARLLGTDAIMTHLVRTRVGPYALEDAARLDSLEELQSVESRLQSASSAVSHLRSIRVHHTLLRRILDGQRISSGDLPVQGELASDERIAILDESDILFAIMKPMEPDVWRCEKGFHSIAHIVAY
jgi:tRNA pseudouridine55 synthase